jgi:polyisoprenoid-binding protein YceI
MRPSQPILVSSSGWPDTRCVETAAVLHLDVADSDSFASSATDLKDTLRSTFGRENFDFLINNAGLGINHLLGSRPALFERAHMSTAATQTLLPTGTWTVDAVHSGVEFQVKHLGIATVKGVFTEFEGTFEITSEGANANGSVQVASVDTREPQRDGHLRSADFFDAEQYPQITFQSTAIGLTDEGEFDLDGDITIHGVTRPVTLRAVLEGTETDSQGKARLGVSASTAISRGDFGMKFNQVLGSGNVVVSDKVKIQLDLSFVAA